MRMILDLPRKLLEQARRVSNTGTNREAVIAGLEELIRKSHHEKLRRLAGRLKLKIDLDRSRGRRRS